MENGKIVFDITKFQSAKLQGFATAFDKDGVTGLSESEQAEFTAALNGNAAMKAELENESEDVKSLLGFKASASAPVSSPAVELVRELNTDTRVKDQAKQEATKPGVYTEVWNAFVEARGYDATKGKYKMTIDDAIEAVEDKFSDKKAYTKEQRKAYKAAVKDLKKGQDEMEAYAAAQTRVKLSPFDDNYNMVNPEVLDKIKTEGDLKKAQKDELRTIDGKLDRGAKRKLRKRHGNIFLKAFDKMTGKWTEGRTDDNSVLNDIGSARVRRDGLAKADLAKEVSPEAIEAFVKYGLIKDYPNDKNKYDVTELSYLVDKAIGPDGYNDHDEKNASENQRVVSKIHLYIYDKVKSDEQAKGIAETKAEITADATPKPELAHEEVRKLKELLGFKDDTAHERLVRTTKGAYEGAGIGGPLGALAGIPGTMKVHVVDEVTQLLTYEGTGLDTTIAKELVKNGLELKEGDGILNYAFSEVKADNIWKAIGLGAAITAVGGAAVRALEGFLKDGHEKDLLGLIFECEDRDQLTPSRVLTNIKSLQGLTDEQKNDLKKIVVLGYEIETVKDENGKPYQRFVMDENCVPKWSFCEFEKKYNAMKGNNVASAPELRSMARRIDARQQKIEDIKVEDCGTETKPPKEEPTQPKCKVVTRGDIKFKEANDCDGHQDANKYGWHEVIQMFYSDCLTKHSEKEIRFALRKANGIPNNLPYVPAGLVLPYQLFEGEDECTRTECRPVKKGKYKSGDVIRKSVKVRDAEFEAGIQCTEENGQTTTTWLKGKYKSNKEAREAGERVLKPAE